MPYVILTEAKKSIAPPSMCENIYWSKVFGSFSSRKQATKFDSYDAAQPTVKQLRKHNPFVYAVEII